MDLDLYKGQILEFASSIPRVGRLDAPDASADAHSRLCGSRITIDIKLDGNVIADYAHEPKACAIGQASASVVARTVVGLTVDEVNDGAEMMTAIFKKKTPPTSSPWSVFVPFLPVADFRSRHNSAFLPFEALQCAIAELGLSLDESTPATTSTEPAART
ncbi:MAG: iron-sulfur cluster assembly scaffold protein [Pseudomonadota bacterium]|nr:iron-sulfur cluster assembly scaffold protein [Pseudomonadota bacterium]